MAQTLSPQNNELTRFMQKSTLSFVTILSGTETLRMQVIAEEFGNDKYGIFNYDWKVFFKLMEELKWREF